MTSRKPPAEDQDIIEGVAVEKQDGGKASGRGGSRRRAARKGASEPKPESSSESASESASAGASGAAGPHGRDNARAPAAASRMPMVVAGLALVVAGAAFGMQYWRAGTVEAGLRAEIDSLSARLAVAEKAQSDAAAAEASLREEIGRIVSGMPADLKVELGELVARVTDLESGLSNVETSRAAPAATGDPALVLAQSGMSVAAAMIADSLAGADPSRWLPVLSELRAAGLAVGDIDALRAAMSPLPPSRDRLVDDAMAMISELRSVAGDGEDGSWWSSATGQLSGFVTLRRKEDAAAVRDPAPDDAPLAAFERALAAGQFAEAVDAGKQIETDMPALAGWIVAAERRAALDDLLAGFGAEMAARLARAGKAG
ncbi:MAG: hypothetical protein VW175_06925 [Alphaproteobacteria bacterium]